MTNRQLFVFLQMAAFMLHYKVICKLDFTNLGILSCSIIRTVGYGASPLGTMTFVSNICI